jgi:hypothetical protein
MIAARQRRCYERKKLARENGNSHAELPSNGATASHDGTDIPHGMSPAAYQRFTERKAREAREEAQASNTFELRRQRYLADKVKKENKKLGRRPDMPAPWRFVGAPGFEWNPGCSPMTTGRTSSGISVYGEDGHHHLGRLQASSAATCQKT